jgi:predicted NBD/HSP70 family sugar kinase
VASRIVPYDDIVSSETLLELILKEVYEALEEGHQDRDRLLGVCLAIPGVFDKVRETTFTPGKKLINHLRLRERIKEMFSVPVVVENDANLIALGYCVETNSKVKDMLTIYFTNGIGMGIISGGTVLTGRAGYAGEIGHRRTVVSETLCDSCGAVGCFQTAATLRYMLYDFHSGKLDMKEILKRQESLRGEFLKALRSGDPEAKRILERAGSSIGDVIGSLIDLFNPELVGVCGNNIEIIKECFETIHLGALERSYIKDDNDTPIIVLENHEELMTLGATEMIFNEWMSSNQLIGGN